MRDQIHRDSLSAWKGLVELGGLELDDRDKDLTIQLKNKIDPEAETIEAALLNTTTDEFLKSLFEIIEPFSQMFQEVLGFFEKAGAREGQSQWNVSVGNEFLDFDHFKDFIENWLKIEFEIEVPALDQGNAFLLNSIRSKIGGYEYLLEDDTEVYKNAGVHEWLENYDNGKYLPLPESLNPERLPPGIDDAARVVIAALSVILRSGGSRSIMMAEHIARSYKSMQRDAFHLWTIAQNENDYWLRSIVQDLAKILMLPENEKLAISGMLVDAFSKFSRRRINANIELKDLEQVLSLPAWKKRYELYGVWIATEILSAIPDHEITIHHKNGELKFAFKEAQICNIDTARPQLSLFSERRVPLTNPIGKSRKHSVQPDFGLWKAGEEAENCKMIIEVKHYKKRSRRNFRDALIDYARAHPNSNCILVNYGPVGKLFSDLPMSVKNRCQMLGHLNPQNKLVREEFYKLIRDCVGSPVTETKNLESVIENNTKLLAIDISGSMAGIIKTSWFWDFVSGLEYSSVRVFLIDSKVRSIEKNSTLKDWFANNSLGSSTSLLEPIKTILENNEDLTIVTDQGGLDSLQELSNKIQIIEINDTPYVKVLKINRNMLEAG